MFGLIYEVYLYVCKILHRFYDFLQISRIFADTVPWHIFAAFIDI